MHLGRFSLLALATVFASDVAVAFEYGGYRSGMGRDAVEAQSKRDKWVLAPTSGSSFMQFRERGSPRPESGFVFSFCNDRLTAVSDNLSGGFPAFAATVTQYVTSLGPGTVKAQSQHTGQGLFSKVEVEWDQSGDRYSVSMTRLGETNETVAKSVWSSEVAAPCRAR